MGVYKLSANSVKNGRTIYGSMLAGNTAYELPGDFQSIATVTVGSGGAASVTFSSIPQGYTHLQIRGISRTDVVGTSSGRQIMRINGDSGSNYAWHGILADGASINADVATSASSLHVAAAVFDSNTANVFQGCVIDILDYANTSKNKTTRSLYGWDANGSGDMGFYSGLWMSTSAITSLTIYARSNLTPLFKQYSSFALYGIKEA